MNGGLEFIIWTALCLFLSGFNSDWNTHCCLCEFDLSDLKGEKEIAATASNSDGLLHARFWFIHLRGRAAPMASLLYL